MLGLKIIRLSVVSLVFILPLTFFPILYSSFELPKILLFYVCTGLIWLGLLIGNYQLAGSKTILYSVLALFGWMLVSSLFGVSLQQSIWGNYFRLQGIVTYLGYLTLFGASYALLKDEFDRQLFSMAVAVSAVFVSMLTITEFISLWIFKNTHQLLYDNRSIATFGQPNFLAAYLVLTLPLMWYLTKTSKNYVKYLVWLAILTTVMAIFLTFSRGAIFGLGCLLLFWGAFHRKAGLLSLIGVVLFFALLTNVFSDITNIQIRKFQVDLLATYTPENRLLIMQKSVELIPKRLISGWGVENFNLAFPSVVLPEDFGLRNIVVDSSHNIFIDKIVETGVVGFGLFIWLIGLVLKTSLKKLSQLDVRMRQFTVAMMVVVVEFLLLHQFSVVSIVPEVFFWVSLGFLANSVVISHKATVIRLRVLLSVLVMLIIGLYCWQIMQADIWFKQASGYEVSNIHQAIKLDNQAVESAPWMLFYTWRRQFLLQQLGQ